MHNDNTTDIKGNTLSTPTPLPLISALKSQLGAVKLCVNPQEKWRNR